MQSFSLYCLYMSFFLSAHYLGESSMLLSESTSHSLLLSSALFYGSTIVYFSADVRLDLQFLANVIKAAVNIFI